jgi:hypothetical protein
MKANRLHRYRTDADFRARVAIVETHIANLIDTGDDAHPEDWILYAMSVVENLEQLTAPTQGET